MLRSGYRGTRVLAMSTALALGLVGCGDDGDDDQSAQTTVAAPKGSALVTINMVDHAFQVSGPLTAGGTIRLVNMGTEFHMIGIGKLKPGKTMADLQRVLAEESGPPGGGASTTTTTARGATTTSTARGATTSTTAAGGEDEPDPTAEIVDEVGLPGAFMSPGESAEVTVPNLDVGTYALLCFIPTEGEGTPHFAKGMVNQLEVVAGPAPAPPTADATYRLSPGKAVEGPATLTAGKHTLKFEAAAGSQQLEPGLIRLNAGSTLERLDAAFVTLFESDAPPAKGAAAQVPGQVVYGGFDLEAVTTFHLTVDLKPGNYYIVAEDTDVETPGTPKEIISIKVA